MRKPFHWVILQPIIGLVLYPRWTVLRNMHHWSATGLYVACLTDENILTKPKHLSSSIWTLIMWWIQNFQHLASPYSYLKWLLTTTHGCQNFKPPNWKWVTCLCPHHSSSEDLCLCIQVSKFQAETTLNLFMSISIRALICRFWECGRASGHIKQDKCAVCKYSRLK